MGKVFLRVLLVLSVSGLSYALDFMGPAKAKMEPGGLAFDFDYAYSKTDLKFTGINDKYLQLSDSSFHFNHLASVEVRDIKLHKSYVNIRYGISENVDAFLKAGVVRTRSEKFFGGSNKVAYDGECAPSFGFGARMTLFEDDQLSVGLLGQATYTKIDEPVMGPSYPYDMDLRFWEVQFAFGPTYRLTDTFTVYGGPFYHYFDGQVEMSYGNNGLFEGRTMADARVDSYWGGYLGLQAALTERISATAEYQKTECAYAVAFNLAIRF